MNSGFHRQGEANRNWKWFIAYLPESLAVVDKMKIGGMVKTAAS